MNLYHKAPTDFPIDFFRQLNLLVADWTGSQ